jgi:hypothetical protein
MCYVMTVWVAAAVPRRKREMNVALNQWLLSNPILLTKLFNHSCTHSSIGKHDK